MTDDEIEGRLDAIGTLIAAAADERAAAAAVRRTVGGAAGPPLDAALSSLWGFVAQQGQDARLSDCCAAVLTERRAQRRHDDAVRATVRSGLLDAIHELRAAPSGWDLAERAAQSVCEAAGFTRAMVSAVRGSRWVPLVVHTRDDWDSQAVDFRGFVDQHVAIPLASMLAETEAVRRRAAVRIDDAPGDRRTFKPIVTAAGSPGYIVAPIAAGARTIGFVHVDRTGQGQPLTEDDRRATEYFARMLAMLFHRAASQEKLERRSRDLRDAVEHAQESFERLARVGYPATWDDIRDDVDVETHRRRDVVLTFREQEVLELVAEGASDRTVAEQLTLSEETIKTHMRSIRRKLHVRTRGAAVATYRRLSPSFDD